MMIPSDTLGAVPLRIRHRPPLSAKPDNTPVQDRLASLSKLKIVFQDTPPRLRELEDGWRERRKRLMKENVPAVGRTVLPPTPHSTPRLPDRLASVLKPHAPAIVSAAPVAGPILSYPLPPTPRPIPISTSTTIHIPSPASSAEIIIFLENGKNSIQVLRGGGQITFSTSGVVKRVVSLQDCANWDVVQKKEWEEVHLLVERFKRRTPRMKIFHTLGHLTISCSTPPDISLSFTTLDRMGPGKGETKVRITYSRLAKDIRIETSSRLHRQEKYQTRRLVPLLQDPLVRQKEQGREEMQTVCDELGIAHVDGWQEVELVGLRRLWDTRSEWKDKWV
ncbi:hypothetical protein P7C73_g977, partial [Tremellales sp. Uapishka_1]